MFIGLYDQHKRLTVLQEDPEFRQYDLNCQRSCLFPLDRAFKSFFRRLKAGQKPGFPRFKGKDRGVRSFSTSKPRLDSHGQWPSLSLKGIGRFRFKGDIPGKVLRARVVKTSLRIVGQLVVDLPDPQSHPQPPLGIDVGVAARATLSDGHRYVGNQVDRERLPVLHQRLSKAKQGSKTRQKRNGILPAVTNSLPHRPGYQIR